MPRKSHELLLSFESIRNIFDLSKRVAVITGAAGGLGCAISFSLAAFGAELVLASRNRENLEKLSAEIEELGGVAYSVPTDITKPDEVDRMVHLTLDRFGTIDILVNNSGTEHREAAANIELEDWNRLMETNLTGAFLCAQRVGKVMIERVRGKIINISSVRGKFGRATDFSAYCASKGGLDALTRALACEWGKYNIQVNSLAPSIIETELSRRSLEDKGYAKRITDRIPLGRWGQTVDLIGAVVFLASDASNFVNGHTLYVDGGYSIAG